MQISFVPLLVGSIMTPIAAVMAYLGAYDEYSRHFKDKKIARKLAIEAAIYFFVLFAIISVAMSLFFEKL